MLKLKIRKSRKSILSLLELLEDDEETRRDDKSNDSMSGKRIGKYKVSF